MQFRGRGPGPRAGQCELRGRGGRGGAAARHTQHGGGGEHRAEAEETSGRGSGELFFSYWQGPLSAPEHLTQVRVNLLYDENKEELKLFLHEAANLPGGDLPDPPDPQCKIYLMPGKKKKKKTEVFKDSVNPKFNEEFDFSVDIKDLKEMYLKVC